jgi:dTDP-4-dehydrorhamnose 3,5-epimerase
MSIEIDGHDEWRVVDLLKHRDPRGFFYEAFRADLSLPAMDFDVAQVNVSVSAKGVFRGLHLMKHTYGQRKYVLCVSGRVLDFALDLREGSPNFGQFKERLLEPGNIAVYIPNGFAHGFLSLEDGSTVVYLCDTTYSPENEVGLNPNDEALNNFLEEGLSKLGMNAPILSAKDASAPSLYEVLQNEKF